VWGAIEAAAIKGLRCRRGSLPLGKKLRDRGGPDDLVAEKPGGERDKRQIKKKRSLGEDSGREGREGGGARATRSHTRRDSERGGGEGTVSQGKSVEEEKNQSGRKKVGQWKRTGMLSGEEMAERRE